MTSSLPPVAQELWWVTCANDLLDLHAGNVYLLGKLAHRLIGVFIGEGVNVDLHSRRYYWGFSGNNRNVNLYQANGWSKTINSFVWASRLGLSVTALLNHIFNTAGIQKCIKLWLGESMPAKRLTVLLQFLCVFWLWTISLLPVATEKKKIKWVAWIVHSRVQIQQKNKGTKKKLNFNNVTISNSLLQICFKVCIFSHACRKMKFHMPWCKWLFLFVFAVKANA